MYYPVAQHSTLRRRQQRQYDTGLGCAPLASLHQPRIINTHQNRSGLSCYDKRCYNPGVVIKDTSSFRPYVWTKRRLQRPESGSKFLSALWTTKGLLTPVSPSLSFMAQKKSHIQSKQRCSGPTTREHGASALRKSFLKAAR
ncbi:hypothetical protein Y032_0718g1802 [Ancylostoma ceylanicum]|uniref:Uncharacterized protein n=1 Tax=Ancylostoma ceylanicum TaxID=53326 RepID=A0A016WF09_9BILA|nr:hypothetical protein Y032_0718g1802 [Ancylostoma ceylanicum]